MIKYVKSNRLFGIHSNRVRRVIEADYRNKYGKDSTEYKNYKERKDLIDQLESDSNKMYVPYGYTSSPERNVESVTDYKTVARDRVNARDWDKHNQDFYNNMWEKFNKKNKEAHKRLQKYKGEPRNITPLYIDQLDMYPQYISLNEEPRFPSSFGRDIKTGLIHVNINPNGSDFEAPHEMQHVNNMLHGYDDNKYTRDYNTFTNKSKATETLSNPDRILDYSNNVLQEELSANRARTMYPWVYNNIDRKTTLRSVNESKDSQSTYNSRIGGYNPVSNRPNVDPATYRILQNYYRNTLPNYKITPNVTGHIDI